MSDCVRQPIYSITQSLNHSIQKTSIKKVVVLNQSEGIKFGVKGRDITVSENMAVADAEKIQALYPEAYVQVIDVASENPAKSAKTA